MCHCHRVLYELHQNHNVTSITFFKVYRIGSRTQMYGWIPVSGFRSPDPDIEFPVIKASKSGHQNRSNCFEIRTKKPDIEAYKSGFQDNASKSGLKIRIFKHLVGESPFSLLRNPDIRKPGYFCNSAASFVGIGCQNTCQITTEVF